MNGGAFGGTFSPGTAGLDGPLTRMSASVDSVVLLLLLDVLDVLLLFVVVVVSLESVLLMCDVEVSFVRSSGPLLSMILIGLSSSLSLIMPTSTAAILLSYAGFMPLLGIESEGCGCGDTPAGTLAVIVVACCCCVESGDECWI